MGTIYYPFKGNKNIYMYKRKRKGLTDMHIAFRDYDIQLTPNYIKEHLLALLERYEAFILTASSHVFDGLYETNSELIKKGCWISNVYGEGSAYFEGVEK